MTAAERARLVAQDGDSPLDRLRFIRRVSIVVRDVGVVTTGESNAHHNACHRTTLEGSCPHYLVPSDVADQLCTVDDPERLSLVQPPTCSGRERA